MNEQNNKAPCPPDAYTPVGDYRYKQRDIDHEKPEKTWKKKNSVEPMRQTGTEAAVIIGTEAACLEDSPHARESSCSGGPQGQFLRHNHCRLDSRVTHLGWIQAFHLFLLLFAKSTHFYLLGKYGPQQETQYYFSDTNKD